MSVQALSRARTAPYEAPSLPPRSSALSHIPGDDGWPILGHTLPLLADPEGFVERRAKSLLHHGGAIFACPLVAGTFAPSIPFLISLGGQQGPFT